MLVHKRRPGQGVVLDGLLLITVQEIAPEVWLLIESSVLGSSTEISVAAASTAKTILLGIRRPASFTADDRAISLVTDPSLDGARELTLPLARGALVLLDGIEIRVDSLEGGEHHGKPLLHVAAPGLDEEIALAVLTRYHYAVDLATDASPSIRIYRSEVWQPAAESNQDAAGWSDDDMRALEQHAPKHS